VRTIFNVLGPLTNPAGADNQVLGVFHPDLVGIQARVLQRLGSRHVLVVHGKDGMDEISISAETCIAELKDGEISEYTVHPSQFGLTSASVDLLRVTNADEACEKLLGVLNNETGAPRDIVQLNAGAAIYVAGLTSTLDEGIAKAGQVIASGAAKNKLDQLVALSNSFKP
jgi:anthranilate phosphoribosyltransferase